MKRSLPDARLRGRTTSKWISELSVACGLLLSVLVLGCAGSLDPGVGAGGSSGSDCQTAIFTAHCVVCHASGSGSAGLDLQTANPGARMLGMMGGASTLGGQCSTMVLLNPTSNPATGVFVDKITLATPPCGSSMPLGSPLLSASDQSCLTTWATSITTAPAAFTGQETP